jgi:hypothetical protein
MKNVLKAKAIRRMAGLITLIAVIGFSMAACDDGNSGPGVYNSGVLPAPTGLRATVSGTSVYITWNAVNDASGYNFYVSGSSSFPANNSNSGRWYSTTYTEDNISPGTYYYKIAAFNANGIEGAMSSVYSFTIGGGTTTPTVPSTSSLDGTWVGESGGRRSGMRITISGSTGVINAFGNTGFVLDAVNKGYVNIGDQCFRNLTPAGNLKWSGQELGYVQFGNVCEFVDWVDCTITMSVDGSTISSYSSDMTIPTATWRRQ